MCFSTLQSPDGKNWAYSDGTQLTEEFKAIMEDTSVTLDYDYDGDGDSTSCLAVEEAPNFDYDWVHYPCRDGNKYLCEFEYGKYEINVLNENQLRHNHN